MDMLKAISFKNETIQNLMDKIIFLEDEIELLNNKQSEKISSLETDIKLWIELSEKLSELCRLLSNEVERLKNELECWKAEIFNEN